MYKINNVRRCQLSSSIYATIIEADRAGVECTYLDKTMESFGVSTPERRRMLPGRSDIDGSSTNRLLNEFRELYESRLRWLDAADRKGEDTEKVENVTHVHIM